MNKKVPIFPLKLVMFPESRYPLHIFEEKYKRLVKRCLGNNEEFGIVAKIDLEISTVGCIVRIDKILRKHENGAMDIVVKGYQRFETLSTNMHKDGYLEAEIETFDDAGIDSIEGLESQTIDKFLDVLSLTDINLDNRFWDNLEVVKNKSYKIAEKAGLNLKQRQNLLSLGNEPDRLHYLINHLNKVEEYLEQNQIMKDIILGDGYIN